MSQLAERAPRTSSGAYHRAPNPLLESMSVEFLATAERRRYTVLAVDGGGIRGVVPARVLQAIEERTGRPAADLFDLIAGTSTGGIIALGLTRPASRGAGVPAYSA